MKINVFTKEIAIIPSICKDNDKFKIIFRYPNQFDSTKLLLTSENHHESVLKIACDLFLRFENKPQLINEDGKEIDYENFSDMLKLGGKDIFKIVLEVVKSLTDAIKEANKTEKKL
ncbi:MAG: hypothetical protein BV457_00200 [Thermoplasmata archaeon M9B1D]|nr:MAG: hypothetical protein BV457_00200 [Thermoplasmata archaeon M9B1D]PNX52214.1 MAG: hypothetical protein BV456_00095 [Thermoplasmata archaeon M8B2D]